MSLIQSEQDDPAVLRAEDEAILAADNPPDQPETALDQLARLLDGDKTPVRSEDES
ncbi:MAG: hypothetical protein Q8Q29_00545 [Actinomycetota bacterium]|nr:hypothetical protein [Actinomycetota bacterium]